MIWLFLFVYKMV